MRVIGRWVYVGLAFVFLLCILGQFFLAGMAVFGGGQYWINHKILVHLFGFNLPLLMMISAFAGKAKRSDYLSILVLFVLIFAMYATANLGFPHSYVGAFHPIIGILLIAFSSLSVYYSFTLALNKR